MPNGSQPRTGTSKRHESSRPDEIATAEEKVTEAIGLLGKIDDIQKAAGAIHKSAIKISTECDTFSTSIERLLNQALAALAGAENAATVDDGQLTSGAA